MGTARRISRNTAYLAAAEMVSKVLQFVVMIYAARLLSQEDFGKFSFALSLSFIAMILADWGLNQLLVRTVARDKGGLEKYVANSIFLKIIFSALSGAFIVIVLNLFRYPQTTKGIVYIIWLFAILGTFTELLYSIFRAFERMEFDSLLKITRMAVLAAASITILALDKGVVAFSVSFVAVEAGVVLMGSLIVWRVFSRGRLSFSLLDVAYMKSMLREALPFGLAILFGSLYFYISGFMLSVMEGDVAVEGVANSVTLSRIRGHITARTVDGPILIRASEGHIKADSITGDLKFVQVNASELIGTTNSGAIHYQGDFGSGGTYVLHNYSSLIEIQASPKASFDMTARSVLGTIESQIQFLPLPPGTPFRRSTAGKLLQGRVGTGKSTVQITSYSGTIRLSGGR